MLLEVVRIDEFDTWIEKAHELADGNPIWSTILKVINAPGLRFELHSVA